MVAQFKAAKKVLALRKAIKAAKPQNKGALQIKLAAAKTALARATRKFHKATLRVEARRILKIQKKIALATDPKRKALLKAQLKVAK